MAADKLHNGVICSSNNNCNNDELAAKPRGNPSQVIKSNYQTNSANNNNNNNNRNKDNNVSVCVCVCVRGVAVPAKSALIKLANKWPRARPTSAAGNTGKPNPTKWEGGEVIYIAEEEKNNEKGTEMGEC